MKSVALLRDIKQAYFQRKIRGEDSDASHVHWLNDLEKNQIIKKRWKWINLSKRSMWFFNVIANYDKNAIKCY